MIMNRGVVFSAVLLSSALTAQSTPFATTDSCGVLTSLFSVFCVMLLLVRPCRGTSRKKKMHMRRATSMSMHEMKPGEVVSDTCRISLPRITTSNWKIFSVATAANAMMGCKEGEKLTLENRKCKTHRSEHTIQIKIHARKKIRTEE